jgi:hypothetical protein
MLLEAIRKKPSGLVVVTSDRAIIDEAKRNNVVFITSERLEASMDGDESPEGVVRKEKKGNARKAPKNVRKARRALRKI